MTTLTTEKRLPPTYGRVEAPFAGRSEAREPRVPTHEEIARRAYDIYVKSGRKEGQCERNWQEAEKSLQEQGECSRQAQGAGALTPSAPKGR